MFFYSESCCIFVEIIKNTEIMARFILDYDTTLNTETKMFIVDNLEPSMVSPNGDSSQYCLTDVIDTIYDADTKNLDYEIVEDYKYLNQLASEGVNYIEICF